MLTDHFFLCFCSLVLGGSLNGVSKFVGNGTMTIRQNVAAMSDINVNKLALFRCYLLAK